MSDEQIHRNLKQSGWDDSLVTQLLQAGPISSTSTITAAHRTLAQVWITIAVSCGLATLAGAGVWFWQSSVAQGKALELATALSRNESLAKDTEELKQKNSALEKELQTMKEQVEALKLEVTSRLIAPTIQPSQPEADGSKIVITAADHIRGDAKAPVTIVVYSDFECPFCLRFHGTLQQILSDYTGRVRLVYRHFPLRSIHPQAQKAAEASECAANQNRFWEMHDRLFELNSSRTMSVATFKEAAKALGLNTTTFNACLDNSDEAARVEKDYQDGIAIGVSGTPGSFIGTHYIAGALPYEEIKSIIETQLKD